jgi:hypothetical protein
MKNECGRKSGHAMAEKKIALGVVRRIGMAGLASFALACHASAADTLCAPTEQVFFNCRIKDSPKLLSVCGRGAEEAARGAAVPGAYLEYRFGSRDKPELVFPKTREGSLHKFWVATEFVRSAFYESHQLSFQSGGTEYRVYAVSQLADAGPDAPPDEYGGVIVTTAGGRDINISCGSVPENGLGGLVRKFGVEHREGQAEPDDVTRASFQLCRAMPFISEYGLDPLNDALMLGLHNLPDIIDLQDGAVARLAAQPRHGNLARFRRTPDNRGTWRYTPDPGFVGNDRVEFLVRGKAKGGGPVEFRLTYKLRMKAENLLAYLPQSGQPVEPVRDLQCLMPAILLDYVETP